MLTWRITWLLLVKAGMVLIAASFLHVKPLHGEAPVEAGRKAELENLVRQDCGSCHGMTMKGGLGRPLLPSSLRSIDKAGIAAVILDGIPGTPMPPWRGLLTEAEAIWIAERLQEGLAR